MFSLSNSLTEYSAAVVPERALDSIGIFPEKVSISFTAVKTISQAFGVFNDFGLYATKAIPMAVRIQVMRMNQSPPKTRETAR